MKIGLKFGVFFHLLVIENSVEIIRGYITKLKTSGIYDSCERIHLNIRYLDVDCLNEVLTLFALMDKFEIVSVCHNDHPFSWDINDNFAGGDISMHTISSAGERSIPRAWRLGEIEGILDACLSEHVKARFRGYDVVLFINSKSISHLLEGHARRDIINNTQVVNQLCNKFEHYEQMLEDACTEQRFATCIINPANICFAYPPKLLEDFNMQEYLQRMYEMQDFHEYLDDADDSRITSFEHRTVVRLSKSVRFYNKRDKVLMVNRHAFANFPHIMNYFNGFENCSRSLCVKSVESCSVDDG